MPIASAAVDVIPVVFLDSRVVSYIAILINVKCDNVCLDAKGENPAHNLINFSPGQPNNKC